MVHPTIIIISNFAHIFYVKLTKMRKTTTMILGRGVRALALFAVMTLGAVAANAETIFEDFEEVTLVDAEGNPLANSWSFGYGLSNGWRIIGGSILTSSGSTDYGLVKDKGKGWNDSDHYLEASYGRTNSAYVFIPQQLQGTIMFYAKSNLSTSSSSSYTSTVKVYEAAEDGTVSSTLLYEKTLTKGGSWFPCIIEGVQGKYIAINLVRANLDDFTAEVGDGSGVVVPEKKAITVTGLQLVTESSYSNPIKANEENQYTAEFAVTVKNSGNVDLAAADVKVQIEDGSKVVLGAATATEPLAVGDEATVVVTVTADAGSLDDSGYNMFTFYAREQLSNIRFATPVYAYVTPYAAKFAINGPDGWALAEGETLSFGTSNIAVTRTVEIKNSGTAPLAVSGISLPEGFTADETAFTMEAGGSKTVTLTLIPEAPYGVKGGTATISHALGEFSFIVSGTAVDPAKFFVNFEDGAFPASWTVGEKWTITTQSGNKYAQQGSTVEATAIITQKLTVAEGEQMTFEAKRAYSYTAATLTVSCSADRETWTQVGSFALESAFATYTLATIPAGDWYLKFEGQYVAIDNIAGFTEAADAPLLGVYVNDSALDSGVVLDFGLANEDATMTLVVKNDGTGTLNAAIAVTGEGFSVSKESVSLGAGETTDLIVTMAAQPWGFKSGTLTIGGMTFDLEGESRDPELLFVDFEDGQWPAGWIPGSKWSIYQNMAEHYDYTEQESELITAKLLVEEGMALRFDAKRSSDIYASSLTVSYSADKQVWLETEGEIALTSDMNTYTVALPVGNYYVMFSGCNVDLDNITGVKLSQDVDHLVTWEADIPEEGMVNNAYTATATITNEGIDGEEVTVRFYMDGEAVLEETAEMAFNETRTFTYTFTPQEAQEDVEAYFEFQYGGLPVEKSDVVTVTIKAEEGEFITLQGTVTDKDTTEPLSGAVVTLTCGDIVYSATTGDDGQYAMPVYKFGASYKYAVSVVMDGYESYTNDTYYLNSFGEDSVVENFRLTRDTTTAIEAVRGSRSAAHGEGYTVGGRHAAKTAKGLRIVNGKKVIR